MVPTAARIAILGSPTAKAARMSRPVHGFAWKKIWETP